MLAMTRDGIPIRVWTWPGNASHQELIRQVKEDQRAGGRCIVREKLRAGSSCSLLVRPGFQPASISALKLPVNALRRRR